MINWINEINTIKFDFYLCQLLSNKKFTTHLSLFQKGKWQRINFSETSYIARVHKQLDRLSREILTLQECLATEL